MDKQRSTKDERGEDRVEHYRICVQGHLDRGWVAYFAGMELTHHADGTTLLRGPVADQAALHGLLQRLGSLGLPILEVRRLERVPDRP
jgi:hypothetical protein